MISSLRASALTLLLTLAASMVAFGQKAQERLGRPDLNAIREAVNDPASPYYYPELLKEFMRNDTTMNDRQFQYFYYGTMFQEDYDPYRPAADSATYKGLSHVYAKSEHSRADRKQMLDYAERAIQNNPIDLKQLTNRIFVFEKNGKYDLAKIWQYKLNRLLLVIASSGTGIDPDNAWVVVYPQHEYDFLNLSGHIATAQKFEPPAFDYIVVQPKQQGDRDGYFFDIGEMLRQYFIKHPSEGVIEEPAEDEEDVGDEIFEEAVEAIEEAEE